MDEESGSLSPRKTRGSPVKRGGRKRKDPNAPSPPMSAYSFFFKEMQATVKTHNPEAKFGEVSKIVASMWDTLDEDAKSTYRRRNDEDKSRYKQELDQYNNSSSSSAPLTSDEGDSLDPEVSAVFSERSGFSDDYRIDFSKPLSDKDPSDIMSHLCVRKGCPNHAVRNSEWEDEYCSNDCVVLHCRNVFEEWTQDRTMTQVIGA